MEHKDKNFGPADVVAIMVAVALDGPFSYRVPEGMLLARGSIVEVPLGSRATLGVVWGPPADMKAHNRLRDIGHKFDVPVLSADLLDLVDWVARYTLAPAGMVLRAILRSRQALFPRRPIVAYQATGIAPPRMSKARSRVLAVLGDGMAWSKSALVKESAVSPSVIDALARVGTLARVELPAPSPVLAPDVDFAPPRLNEHQKKALAELRLAATSNISVCLLDGVTGSGKTEVFFEAVADTLRAGRQALIMLPEIALTHTFIERFIKRFGVKPAQWHSDMSPAQRALVWRAVLQGEVRALIGARSALFLPFDELGLVVVDEEHDGAYKQSDGISYHARDMAVVRANLAGAQIILSSATPSIESFNNASQGRYKHVRINVRHDDAQLPDIATIDMRVDGPEKGRWISPLLEKEISATLARGEQALLFLNRRGYAPLTLCRACGYKYQCPDCSSWMVEHRFAAKLACHYCGLEIARPLECAKCGEKDTLVPIGPGIERVAEEAGELFADARQVILSSDMGTTSQIRERFEEICAGKYDLIIGTQLVAKGHHFEKLTLVGVLDADLGLAHGDPRAAEKTFQLLTQVTGRAGRAAKTGRAFLQTYHPEHSVIKAMVAGDRDGFYAHELEVRKQGGLPPFGRLAGLVVSASEHDAAFSYGRHLLSVAPKAEGVRLFGPVDAPVAMVRARHRVRLLVQAKKGFDLSAYVRFWLKGANKPGGNIKVRVDIDPISFY
ncbi:Helicase PriA essential for oriC/DnaA-independent DNA replication [hydrothermal vent metagenome]|uniref:DNA 3'-5' helicase n=1 Tax=hydrothermal vent metagenome TaxID=652676 RepID=A0A3B0U1C5_9ZZZZ